MKCQDFFSLKNTNRKKLECFPLQILPGTHSSRKEGISVIGLDKGGYLVNIFLISPQKHILWVLIRSASMRHFK